MSRTEMVFRAAAAGDLQAVKAALETGFPVNVRDREGETLLLSAVHGHHDAVVQLLLEQGADADAMDARGRVPLFYAVQHRPTLLALLAAGADPFRAIQGGFNLLMAAAAVGDEAGAAGDLIAKGIPVNAMSERGHTALGLAARSGHINAVRTLLAHGADVNPVGAFPPLAAAADECDAAAPEIRTLRFSPGGILFLANLYAIPEILRVLIEAGARVDGSCTRGITPLMYAASRGNVRAMHVLLESGADIKARDALGWGPLHHAAASNQAAACSWLLSKGADAQALDLDGETPLECARRSGGISALRVLERLPRE